VRVLTQALTTIANTKTLALLTLTLTLLILLVGCMAQWLECSSLTGVLFLSYVGPAATKGTPLSPRGGHGGGYNGYNTYT